MISFLKPLNCFLTKIYKKKFNNFFSGNLDSNLTCEWRNWTNWEACTPEEEYCSLFDEEPNKWSKKSNATFCECDSNDVNGNATLKDIACGLGGYHLESCDNKSIHDCQGIYNFSSFLNV